MQYIFIYIYIYEQYVLGGGPLPGPQGVTRTCTRKIFVGLGDHFQVLKLSFGTCISTKQWGWGTTSRSARCRRGHVPSHSPTYGTAYVPAYYTVLRTCLLPAPYGLLPVATADEMRRRRKDSICMDCG